MNELLTLKELLDHHDDLYYKQNAPEITDEEYDALRDRYRQLQEDEGVPSDIVDENMSIPHKHAVLSLEKVTDETELRKKVAELWPIVVQPKIDGMTLLALGDVFLTRGDGYRGEVMANANKIPNMRINREVDHPVRMEVFMNRADLAEVNLLRTASGEKLFENTRNAVPGILRKGTPELMNYLKYAAYNRMGLDSDTDVQQLAWLRSNGWDVVPNGVFSDESGKTIDDAVRFIMSYKDKRDRLAFDIDGLVIKSIQPNAADKFGTTGHHPKSAFAWKFESSGEWTKILSITWQTGRTGKVTPVAELVPVRVLGSEISRTTLHNTSIMAAIGIQAEGQEVYVIKANDVIPAITATRPVVEPAIHFEIPTKCPVCGSSLTSTNQQLFCENPVCAAKLVGNIVHLVRKEALDVEGISEETARKLVATGKVEYPWDIFNLTIEDLEKLPGFAKRSATTLYNRIQKAKKVEMNQFLYAVGIPTVGRTASRLLMDEFGNFADLIKDVKAGCPRISAMPNFGPITIDNIQKFHVMWLALFRHVTPKNIPAKTVVVSAPTVQSQGTSPSSGQGRYIFVLTGSMSKTRGDICYEISKAGHHTADSITRYVSALVQSDPRSTSSKSQKAIKLGIPIISEIKLYAILAGRDTL